MTKKNAFKAVLNWETATLCCLNLLFFGKSSKRLHTLFLYYLSAILDCSVFPRLPKNLLFWGFLSHCFSFVWSLLGVALYFQNHFRFFFVFGILCWPYIPLAHVKKSYDQSFPSWCAMDATSGQSKRKKLSKSQKRKLLNERGKKGAEKKVLV